MNKKIIAALLAVTLLTACGSNNGDNKKNINGNKNVEESAGDELDKQQDNQQDTQTGEESKVDKSQDEHPDDINQENFKKENIEISEDRFSLTELLSDNIGEMKEYIYHDGSRKLIKLIDVYWPYQSPRRYYHYAVIRYDKDPNKEPEKYSELLTAKWNGSEINQGGRRSPFIDEKKAVAEKIWYGDSETQLYGTEKVHHKVTHWDSSKLIMEIFSSKNSRKNLPKGYYEKYTFEKGKGLIAVDIKNGENHELKSTEVRKLDHESMLEYQAKIWKGIDKKYIEGIPGLNGYFRLKEEFFKELLNQLEISRNKDTFKSILGEMPHDSLDSLKYIAPMAKIMYTETGDITYLLEAVKEYEKRIDELNKVYAEDASRLPYIFQEEIFRKDYMTGIQIEINELKDRDKILVDTYMNNMVDLTPKNGVSMFSCKDEFLKEFKNMDVPEGIRDFLTYKTYEYRGEFDDTFEECNALIEAMIGLEKLNKSQYTGDMFKKLITPELIDGKITRIYLYKLDNYLKKSGNPMYRDKIKDIKKLISEDRFYTEELDNYLKTLGVDGMYEHYKKDIEEDKRSSRDEMELYLGLKENQVKLQEIDLSNAVEVWTGDQFLQAVKDGAVIKVMDDIKTNGVVKHFSEEVSKSTHKISIRGIENLTIVGVGDYPVKISVGSYEEAIKFSDCSNITLRNISIGHSWKPCTAEVIGIENSSGITIENSIIYGCGAVGLIYIKVNDISVRNTLIWDCKYRSIHFEEVEDGELTNVILNKNGKNEISYEKCKNIKEADVEIGDELYD